MDANELEQYRDLVYFEMNMLQARIEMEGMVATNQNCAFVGADPQYTENDFKALIEKHGVHHNAFPMR